MQLSFLILRHRVRSASRFMMFLQDTAADFFLFALKRSSFLAVGDYAVETLTLLSDHDNFPHKYHLFRSPLQISDKGWRCMTFGTWHVVSLALTSEQEDKNHFLSLSAKPEVGCSVHQWFSSCFPFEYQTHSLILFEVGIRCLQPMPVVLVWIEAAHSSTTKKLGRTICCR